MDTHDAVPLPGGSGTRRAGGDAAVRRRPRRGRDRLSRSRIVGADVSRARRSLDVVVSALALVLTAPILLVAAAAIRATSSGPVLFRQQRLGAGRRPFTILKLRTMTTGGPGLDITMRSDPRVTPVGSVLRRTSLDELPQLLNVLRGEMTLVGPRPETVALADGYPARCRWVLEHTPGLTGPAQIRLRDARVLDLRAAGSAPVDPQRWYLEEIVPRRVELDATYLRDPTLRRTLVVLLQTAVYLLRPQ
ncbi:sugar transferase [Terrabacter sp. NPDC080008]|uniref:sugar transferase n=1 Tax=Terrabacter sp. NPDC080008 TaxID=3155176 RepID=UPI00344C3C96